MITTGNMEYIKFNISLSETDSDGHYKHVQIHNIEDGTSQTAGAKYEKLMSDIIMHALEISDGVDIKKESAGFPYTFPFTF